MADVIPGRNDCFPAWTYTCDIQAVRDKTERLAREAYEDGRPVPRYDDWRDFFSRAAYSVEAMASLEQNRLLVVEHS